MLPDRKHPTRGPSAGRGPLVAQELPYMSWLTCGTAGGKGLINTWLHTRDNITHPDSSQKATRASKAKTAALSDALFPLFSWRQETTIQQKSYIVGLLYSPTNDEREKQQRTLTKPFTKQSPHLTMHHLSRFWKTEIPQSSSSSQGRSQVTFLKQFQVT